MKAMYGMCRLGAAAALVFVTACAHDKIPNTNIDDTEENREVLSLVQSYRTAVESLDVEAVLALVSPNYFEDNGNTDDKDDYGFDGLKENLQTSFARTKAIQLLLRVDAIEVEDNKVAFAELYYEYRAQVDYPSGLKWDTATDRTRLRLVRSIPDDKESAWRITAGL